MKIQNVAVQLQLGESLIHFTLNIHWKGSILKVGIRLYIWDRCLRVHGNFFYIWTFSSKILCKNF